MIATASRPETRQWCLDLGAHHVIDHSKSFAEQLRKIGISEVQYIVSLTGTDTHYLNLVDVLAPQGKFALIDDPESLDARPIKRKSASLHWEFMFADRFSIRPIILAQHRLLNQVADLVDTGVIRTTVAETLGTINAANLKKAHALIESGRGPRQTCAGRVLIQSGRFDCAFPSTRFIFQRMENLHGRKT